MSLLPECEELFCGCLTARATAFLISVISLLGCLAENAATKQVQICCCPLREMVRSARNLILTLFQIVNILLLLASIFENAFLVQIYVWYTLAFVVMGLVVTLLEFLINSKNEGPSKSLALFLPEVIFLFMICRCMPLVDRYRQQLEKDTVVADLKASQYSQYSGIKLEIKPKNN